MPTLKHPAGSNVTPGQAVPASYHWLAATETHIYLVVAAAAIVVAVHLVKKRFGSSHRAQHWAPKTELRADRDSSVPPCRKDSAASYSKRHSPVHSSCQAREQRGFRFSVGLGSRRITWTAGHFSLGAGPRQLEPAVQPPLMDGLDKVQRKDRSGLSASEASRGVSTSNPRHLRNPPPSGGRSIPPETRQSRSPRSLPPASSTLNPVRGSDGAEDKASKGKGPMEGQGGLGTGPWRSAHTGNDGSDLVGSQNARSSLDIVQGAAEPLATVQSTRPPLPPPLTPLVLGTTVFPFEERRHGYAVSIPPELDAGFIHQPNPDYGTGFTPTELFSSSPNSAPGTPAQTSYTQSIPIAIPASTSAWSSTETMTSLDTFSPSSYPPRSPLLPPPPPGHDLPYNYQLVGGPGGPGIVDSIEEIDIHGEMISVLEHADHGWRRHTRVYGGGVCLACAAAGEEGGFYGDKVPLQDRRR